MPAIVVPNRNVHVPKKKIRTSRFLFVPPEHEINDPKKRAIALVSRLKRAITRLDQRAQNALNQKDYTKYANLKLASIHAAKELREVIDGKVVEDKVEGVLNNAITVAELTLDYAKL